MKHEKIMGVLAAAITLGLIAGLMAQDTVAPAKDVAATPACAMMCSGAKGSDKCSKPGAVKRDKCGTDKDSPGCRKPDVLGKAIPCGMDASKCGTKAAPAEMPTAPAEAAVPATTPAAE